LGGINPKGAMGATSAAYDGSYLAYGSALNMTFTLQSTHVPNNAQGYGLQFYFKSGSDIWYATGLDYVTGLGPQTYSFNIGSESVWAAGGVNALTWAQGFGIGLATLGVLLVVTQGDLASLAVGEFGTPGDFLVMISALNWAVFSALSRRGLQKFPATQMMFYVMALGWLFTSILFFAGPGTKEIAQLEMDGWLAVGFLGVFCSGLSYIFWYDGLQVLPVAQAGAFVYLEPFVTVVIAALLLDEPLLLASMIGGAAILFGVWMVSRKKS
jgi:uncharacterized membrane protein